MFSSTMLIVYVDPSDKDNYQKVLETLCQARREAPIDLKKDSDDNIDINREQDVMFVISETANLMFYQFKEHQGPQAAVFPFNENENILKTKMQGL